MNTAITVPGCFVKVGHYAGVGVKIQQYQANTVVCPTNTSAVADAAACEDAARRNGMHWAGKLVADLNWIHGCFQGYHLHGSGGAVVPGSSKKVYWNHRPNATSGAIGGHLICQSPGGGIKIQQYQASAAACPANTIVVPDAAACKDAAYRNGMDWSGILTADLNWIHGCFQWNPVHGSVPGTSNQVYWNQRPNAKTAIIGGHRVCQSPASAAHVLPTGITTGKSAPASFKYTRQGFCSSGYYRGRNSTGGFTLQTCASLCSFEPKCRYFAIGPGGVCFRYDASALQCRTETHGTIGYHVFSKTSHSECRTFSKTANAAIKGHNVLTQFDQTAHTCIASCCKHNWCNSVDFERVPGICQLSDKREADVRLADWYNYHDKFDHYERPETNYSLATARSTWLSVLGNSSRIMPEQVSIKDGACTYLPGLTSLTADLLDRAVSIIVPMLKDDSNLIDFDTFAGHDVGEDGDIAVLVEFDAGSSDLFTFKFKHARSKGRGRCTENIKLIGTIRGDLVDMDVLFQSRKMSLKTITARYMSNHAPPKCQATSMGLALDLDFKQTKRAIAATGKLSDEPLFFLSWLDSGTHQATGANSSSVALAITCPKSASLTSPFILHAPTGTVLQKGTGDHVLCIRFPRVRTTTGGDLHDAVAGTESSSSHTGVLAVCATDRHNVSSIALSIAGAHVPGDSNGQHALCSDFHGNVTFTATNLFGQTASCTTLMTTFKKSNLWNKASMSVTGDTSNDRATDTTGAGVLYYANGSYKIPGPEQQFNSPKRTLFQNYFGHASDIAFHVRVTPQQNGLVYIDQQSGDMLISPTDDHLGMNSSSKHYTAELRARDEAGAEASVQKWSFTVEKRPQFRVLGYSRNAESSSRSSSGTEIVHNMTQRVRAPFAAGSAFRIPATNLTEVENADARTCTFTLNGNASSAGLFINPATGEVQGLIEEEGFYQMTLIARAKHGAEAILEDVVFDVRRTDTDLSENGPGRMGCGNNGEAVDEPDKRFDGKFTCKCDSRFQGANCELEAPASTGADSGEIVAGVFLFVIVILCILYVRNKYQEYTEKMAPVNFASRLQELLDSGVLQMAPKIARADSVTSAARPIRPRELKRSWLTLVDRLGKGNFGDVWKCTLDDGEYKDVPPYLVAAKTVLEGSGALAAEEDLLKEAALMAQVGQHINVVSLIGVITAGRPRTLVVSYCENGNLIDWLRHSHADGKSATSSVKIQMCCDIAVGMDHLASCHIVHRDLAARNILLASRSGGSNTCKVADFGLSKAMRTGEEYYRLEHGQCFPVKWTAPEAIKEGRYSTATDIWSFAITAIEVFQDGKMPYVDMSNPEVLALVEQQGYHSRPPQCAEEVYAVLTTCFRFEPSQRPSFAEVVEHFRRMLSADDEAGRQAAQVVHSDGLHGAAPQQLHHDLRSGVYSNGQDNLFNLSADIVGELGATATQLPVSTDSVRISLHRPHMEPIELQNADRAPPPGHYVPLHPSTVVTDNAQYVQRGLQRVSSLLATTGNTTPGWEPANYTAGEQSRGGMPTRQESITSFGEPTHLEEASVTEASSGLVRGRGRGRSSTSVPRPRSSRPAPAQLLPRSLVQQTPDAPATSLAGSRARQMHASRGSSGSAEVMLGWEKPRDVFTIYEAVGNANVIRSDSADGSMGIDGQISIDAQASIPSGGTGTCATPYAEQSDVTEVVRVQQHFGTLACTEDQIIIETQFSIQSGSATMASGINVAPYAVHTHVSEVVRAHRHTAGLIGQTAPVQSSAARCLHDTPAAEHTTEEHVADANDRLHPTTCDMVEDAVIQRYGSARRRRSVSEC